MGASKAYLRAYYRRNRKRLIAAQLIRDKKNWRRVRRYRRAYYQKHRQRLLAAERRRGRRKYRLNPRAKLKRNAAWAKANPKRVLALARAYRERNPAKVKRLRRAHYLKNIKRAARQARLIKLKSYGLTLAMYRALSKAQDHRCAICSAKRALKNKPAKLYVDHCHKTGRVRGLLCQKCNAALGMLADSPALLRKAIAYLTRSLSGVTSTTSRKR